MSETIVIPFAELKNKAEILKGKRVLNVTITPNVQNVYIVDNAQPRGRLGRSGRSNVREIKPPARGRQGRAGPVERGREGRAGNPEKTPVVKKTSSRKRK